MAEREQDQKVFNETAFTEIPTTRPEIEEQVGTLTRLLYEQLKCARRITTLVKKRLLADARGNVPLTQHYLDLEGEALLQHAIAERERIAILTEIGQILAVSCPSRMRIAQLIFYVSPDVRDELLEIREDIRDVADELCGLLAWGSKLERHSFGRVSLYMPPDISEEKSKRWLIERLKDSMGRGDATSLESTLGQAEPSFQQDS